MTITLKKALAALSIAAVSFAPAAFAQEITGAGASFPAIFKVLSGGLDFSQGSVSGSQVALPTNTLGQGGYQVDIMGDKMRLLLDNQAIKNSRVV